MCLTINKEVEDRLRAKAVDGKVIGWKVLYNNESYHFLHIWTAGLNTSDRGCKELTCIEKVMNSVKKGFHVFLNGKDASNVKHTIFGSYINVISVTCDIEDLVAAGYDNNDMDIETAVFMKVTF